MVFGLVLLRVEPKIGSFPGALAAALQLKGLRVVMIDPRPDDVEAEELPADSEADEHPVRRICGSFEAPGRAQTARKSSGLGRNRWIS